MENKFLTTAIILSISHISAMEPDDRLLHKNLPKDTLNEIITRTGVTSPEQLILWKEILRKPLTIDLNQHNTDFLLKILEKAKEWNVNMTLKLLNYNAQHLTQIANNLNASQIVSLEIASYVGTFFPGALQEIMKMANLEVLNLSGNVIHWSTMNYLNNNMPENSFLKLKELNLSNTNFQAENVQQLKEAFAKIGNHHIKIII